MTRLSINLLCITLLMISSYSTFPGTNEGEQHVCTNGKMCNAWYPHGINETIPNIKAPKNGLVIWVDTSNKASNFVSHYEEYCRRSAAEKDTLYLSMADDWSGLSPKQKRERIQQQQIRYITEADALHKANQGAQQVWIINNTKDTINFQMQDGSYICILQAKTRAGTWKPIEYWDVARCGNSYDFLNLAPNMANSFITSRSDKGNLKTMLRYKLLGVDRFYYSNEFQGIIDECEFVEEFRERMEQIPNGYRVFKGSKIPRYKLEQLINFVN